MISFENLFNKAKIKYSLGKTPAGEYKVHALLKSLGDPFVILDKIKIPNSNIMDYLVIGRKTIFVIERLDYNCPISCSTKEWVISKDKSKIESPELKLQETISKLRTHLKSKKKGYRFKGIIVISDPSCKPEITGSTTILQAKDLRYFMLKYDGLI